MNHWFSWMLLLGLVAGLEANALAVSGGPAGVIEKEYKFRPSTPYPTATLRSIQRKLRSIGGFNVVGVRFIRYLDYILDSPSGDLTKNGVKLRVRPEPGPGPGPGPGDGGWWIEFKGKTAISHDGASSRFESAPVPIDSAIVDDLLRGRVSATKLLSWPPVQLVAESLGYLPVLQNVLRMQTRRVDLALANAKNEQMELSLDRILYFNNQGEVAPRFGDDVEIELEGVSATAEDHASVAEKLRQSWSLMPWSLPKEVHGLRLLGLHP